MKKQITRTTTVVVDICEMCGTEVRVGTRHCHICGGEFCYSCSRGVPFYGDKKGRVYPDVLVNVCCKCIDASVPFLNNIRDAADLSDAVMRDSVAAWRAKVKAAK